MLQLNYNYSIKTDSIDKIEPLNDAISVWENTHYDTEEAGDYSATDLINPPRITALKKRHADDLYVPTSSKIQAFFGTAVHNAYELLLKDNPIYELEQRLRYVISDRVITGKFDILKDKEHIYDIKTVKVWKTIFDPTLKDWHEQQNIYALLLLLNNYEIKSINIIAHYNDWIESMALRNQSYPTESVIEYSLSLWDEKDSFNFVSYLVEKHKSCETIPDNDLPECSPEDRWERFSDGTNVQYALFRDSQSKRATKIFSGIQEAVAYGKTNKGFSKDSFVEVRYPERKRCEKYCSVAKHCNHHQEYMSRKTTGKLNDYIPLYN